MTGLMDMDDLRRELRTVTAPPVDLDSTLTGPLVRQQALGLRRRRRTLVLAAAAAVVVVTGVASLALGGSDSTTTAPPAGDGRTSSGAIVDVPAGLQSLSTPIEIRDVIGTPPCNGTTPDTYPLADGGEPCFQLGPTYATITTASDLSTVVGDGGRTELVLTLRDADAAALREVESHGTVELYLAAVVDGRVWTAPGLGEHPEVLHLTAATPARVQELMRLLNPQVSWRRSPQR